MLYKYNEAAKPPAPYCSILIENFDRSRQADLEALLDTGSDISFLPLNVARRLALRYFGTGRAEGIGGDQVASHIFQAFFSLERETPKEINMMTWNEDLVLLGRDVLNQYHITLDVPNQTLTITR